jgi:hypothetical protein
MFGFYIYRVIGWRNGKLKKEEIDEIKFIVKYAYSLQKHRIGLSNWIEQKNRDRLVVKPSINTLYTDIVEREKESMALIRDAVKDTNLWDEFFVHIKGVGELLAGSLIAEIGDISKFELYSRLCAYSGMIASHVLAECEHGHKMVMASTRQMTCRVFKSEDGEYCGGEITKAETVEGKAPRRKRGYHYLFNTRLKTVLWKVGEQIMKKTNPFYRDIYLAHREKLENKNKAGGYPRAFVYGVSKAQAFKNRISKLQDNGYGIVYRDKLNDVFKGVDVLSSDEKVQEQLDEGKKYPIIIKEEGVSSGHIFAMAKRKAAKVFLFHFYEAWRTLEGLPVRPPYVIEKLGHTGFVSWQDLKKVLIAEEAAAKENLKKKKA